MRFDMTESELNDVRTAVRSHLKELVTELARADRREARSLLHAEAERFEAMLARLDRATAPERPAVAI